MSARLRRGLVCLAALAPGCEPVDEDTRVGEHFDITFEREARRACTGTAEHLDDYIERAFEFFEAEAPQGAWVPISVVEQPPCTRSACYRYDEHRIYIKNLDELASRPGAVLRHELSHAVVSEVWGQSASFFDEGLAESLSPTSHWGRALGEDVAVSPYLDAESGDIDYALAARFTRFLIDSRGRERFKRLFQGARDLTGAEIQRLAEEVYGEPFAAIEADFLSGPTRCTFLLDPCDPTRAEPVDQSWSTVFAADCADPDFYGSSSDEDVMMGTRRNLELTVGGRYRIRGNSRMTLVGCGDCEAQRVFDFPFGADAELDLAAGSYALEFQGHHSSVVEVELTRVEFGEAARP